MGNTSSRSADNHVFKNELTKLNSIINNIINDDDLFKNNKYNFLSQDVCKKYQVILEEELKKHLKLSIKSLGTSLYLIPKNEEEKLTRLNISKQEVCEKISNHYVKILYILTLIKYVYNIEKDGDLSMAGIAFRNIRILDDVMEINFCDLPHKNYNTVSPTKKRFKIDFSNLEGFKFFVDFFLDKSEAHVFLTLMRDILARTRKGKLAENICNHKGEFTANEFKDLEIMYAKRYADKLHCKNEKAQYKSNHIPSISMDVVISKDNPIFSNTYCSSMKKIIIKTNTKEGRTVFNFYKEFKSNYDTNITKILGILDKLVTKQSDDTFSLKDIDKNTLDTIVEDVKICIKTFYIQSIVDFQKILDQAKITPNIGFS